VPKEIMENHPIPQDVTGFKFKIIGSMTIKQFAYIIVAGVLCTLTFIMPLTGFAGLIKIPLMATFAGCGFALAFVPIGGRPLDKMLVYYASSIPKENQFVYHKQGVNLQNYDFFQPLKVVHTAQSNQPQRSNEKRTALASALRNSYFRPDDQEMQYFASIKASFDDPSAKIANPTPLANEVRKVLPVTPVALPTATPVLATQPVALPTEPPVIKEREVINPLTPVQEPVTAAQVKEKIQEAPLAPTATPDEAQIEKQLEEVKIQEQTVGKTQNLEDKIKELEKQLAEAHGQNAQYQQQVLQQAKSTPQPAVVATEKQAPPAQNVTSVTSKTQLNSGFPTLPDIANIVLGIVKDPRGKVLQNILVEVVDSNEIPVRAFKTNALGQFISATPLPNGIYKVYFDDPGKNQEFEAVQVEMKGEIFHPIEIVSIDQREKLRRDLFGNSQVTPQPLAPMPSPVV
jgi:hypothetical protein